MRFTLASVLALFSVLTVAAAGGCDCFDYTAADAGSKCNGNYNSNKMTLGDHCKNSGLAHNAVCCGTCSEFGC